jgi:hypothetical protein
MTQKNLRKYSFKKNVYLIGNVVSWVHMVKCRDQSLLSMLVLLEILSIMD